MRQQKRMWKIGLALSLSGALLGSCRDSANDNAANPEATPNTPTGEAIAPTLANGQPLTCDTNSYRAEITWNQDQANLGMLQKPSTTLLPSATPATITNNPDGSRTFGYQQDTTTYARFFPSGECFIQILSSTGEVLIEQPGQFATTPPASPGSPPASPSPSPDASSRYQEGYDRGYELGFRDGGNFRRFNSGYNPDAAFQSGAMSGDETYDEGFQDGFYEGFEIGYNNFITEEPNQDDLSMTCDGMIQNDVDFTAFYTREGGFGRVELRPRMGTQTLTSQLTYDGKDNNGHGIWRGSVAQMADVVLVHLSTDAPKQGDEVSVGYDNRWGRANCR